MQILYFFENLPKKIQLVIIIVVISAVTNIPLTYSSYLWKSFKIVKQKENCITGLYQQVNTNNAQITLDATLQYNECNQNFNQHKPNFQFIKEDIL